ncbi:ras-like protein family member 11A-like isoform X2 [Xenopus laevis]|uniref:small monomeric GTPase n=1 Tax=Xenopus laevis TaxID=8355 RepID=A0A8J0TJ68_XENLA|nr:ras-like protein family member 11A-like isoform X2 [Xenopus laevis]
MSQYSNNYLLVPIPEYPILDCAPNKNIKIVVLGGSGVGKTGALYSRKVTIDGEQISLQVQDTPYVSMEDDTDSISCQEQINRSIYWADGYVFVFSITDYNSFHVIRPLYQHLRKIHPNTKIPLLLVGNKADLLRARQVAPDEGLLLANELGGFYAEVSAREHYEGVYSAFYQLCQDVGKVIFSCNGEKRKGLHLGRPRSPNMQELKRRFKQVLSSKVKATTTL